MLKKIKRETFDATQQRFAIVASKYNGRYVDAMLKGAVAELKRAGARQIKVVRVPGAFEIPVVAGRLARCDSPPYAALICLGVIFRGATPHAQHIGESVSLVLAQMQAHSGVPIIHEVLLLENRQQGVERCLDARHNRGTEAAQTALAMAKVMRSLS